MHPIASGRRPLRSGSLAAALLALLVQVLLPLAQVLHLQDQGGGAPRPSSDHVLLAQEDFLAQAACDKHEADHHNSCAVCAAIQSLRSEIHVPEPSQLNEDAASLRAVFRSAMLAASYETLGSFRPRAPPLS